jgi:SAM-dependent methyltransferase
MDLRRAIAFSKKINGWYAEEELEALWKMCVDAVQSCGIVEVGCFAGRTSSLLAHFVKTLAAPVPLIFIDPYSPDYMKGFNIEGAKSQFTRCLREIGTPYKLIERRTVDTNPADLPPQVDLVHVDGDHTKNAVENDCQLLLPLVREGGIACFHDYGRQAFAVTAVVDTLCADWTLIGTFGTVRALRKKTKAPMQSQRFQDTRALWA